VGEWERIGERKGVRGRMGESWRENGVREEIESVRDSPTARDIIASKEGCAITHSQ
jgi:hypothetical protein